MIEFRSGLWVVFIDRPFGRLLVGTFATAMEARSALNRELSAREQRSVKVARSGQSPGRRGSATDFLAMERAEGTSV